MIDLLSKLDPKDLYRTIGKDKIAALDRLVAEAPGSHELVPEKLAKYVLSIYGYDLLYEADIRRLIFGLIDPERLKELSKRFSGRSYEKAYDNALLLSSCLWKTNSEFVVQIAKELKIPKEFLPLKNYINKTIEVIDPIDPINKLHKYQQELKALILSALSNDEKRFLVQMPTGSGKTRTVIEALLEFIESKEIIDNELSVIWLAHSEELCEQAIDTLKDVWQNLAKAPLQIVRCWGSYEPTALDISGSFVVGTFQKFYSMLSQNSDVFGIIKSSVKILIVDEAHKAIAPSYARVINDLANCKDVSLIGLTATPGRGVDSRENMELSNFFNKKLISPKFSGNAITELRKQKVLASVNKKIIKTGIDIYLSDKELKDIEVSFDISNSALKNLASNSDRNKIIIDAIVNELDSRNPCLVFSCSVEHSKLLSAALNYKGYNSAYIDCSMRKGSRKRIVNGFKDGTLDVLCNFGVLSTGFDAPRIRSIIITRPTASVVLYSQMIGRGLRGPLMGGSETCNLIDIKDNYKNFGGVEEVYAFFEEYWK